MEPRGRLQLFAHALDRGLHTFHGLHVFVVVGVRGLAVRDGVLLQERRAFRRRGMSLRDLLRGL